MCYFYQRLFAVSDTAAYSEIFPPFFRRCVFGLDHNSLFFPDSLSLRLLVFTAHLTSAGKTEHADPYGPYGFGLLSVRCFLAVLENADYSGR